MNVSRILLTITLLGYFGFSKAQIYQDKDNDGYGTGTAYLLPPPDGYNYVTQNGDCNDNNRSINPGRSESFDGIDNNCKNGVDEGFAIPMPTAPTVTRYCGITRLTRGNSPYSFVTWHWQSSPTGTNTSTGVANNSTSTYKEFTSGSVYYLRARHTPTGRWSTARTINYGINTVPSAPATPSVSNQCGRTVLTKGTSPSGITWYWQSSPSGTSTSNSSGSITRTSGSVYYLRARNNSTGCWSSTRSVSYSVNAVPSVPATPSVSNQCGSTVLTRGTAPSGITWYWQSSASGTSTSNASASVTRTSGSVYYLRARSNSTGCWSSVRSVGYSVNTVPSVPATPSVSNQCGRTVLTRSAAPSGITWYWQSSSSGTSTSNSAGSITRTSGSVYYLRARSNSTGCWSGARGVGYSVNAVPSVPATPSVSNQCGSTVLTRGTAPSGITWYWQSSASGTSTSNASVSMTRTSGSVYYLRARNNSTGCWGSARVVGYSVNAVPSVPATPSVSNQCGSTVLTKGTAPSGITWYWQSSATGTSTSNSSASVTRTSGTTYYLRARNNTSLCWGTTRAVNYGITQPTTWYADSDGDGYGNASVTLSACNIPPNYVSNNNDYDDTTIHITNIAPHYFYQDSDGDGFGDPNVSVYYSVMPSGYVIDNTDQCPNEAGPYNGCKYAPVTLSDENYVYTGVYQVPMSDESEMNEDSDVIESVTYFDGLGRAKQSIEIKAAPDKKDIITHMGYDAYGRQAREWLPHRAASGSFGSFRSTAEADTDSYYVANYQGDIVSATPNPFSERAFDASPLDRILKQAAPGYDWRMGGGHEVEFGYAANAANEVRQYRVTTTVANNTYAPTLVSDGHYAARALYKTITYDENHASNSKLHSTEEFTDKQGRVVLKRTYALVGGTETAHDTYYVYDDFGNLTYTLPPKVVTGDGVSATELSELCYQYKYDHRNRLVEKKVPGKGTASTWEEIVYNKLDRPILTRDPNLKANDQWLFTKYDAFGRVAYTGLVSSTSSRSAHQTAADQVATQYESVSATPTKFESNTVSVHYGNDAYPKTNISKIHTVNHYDSYMDTNGLSVPTKVLEQATATNTRGLATVGKVRVLGTSNWITTITGYDVKGRPIYTASKNTYLGTTDVVETQLDFGGKVVRTKTSHTKGTNAALVTTDDFSYDHRGRLVKQEQTIGSHTETIVENYYDDLGQLVSKKVGGGLQDVDYRYNVRGWLTDINDVGNTAKLFNFRIGYNQGTNPLYNGNISRTQWRTANSDDSSLKSYDYTYDALNRIISAADNTGKFNVSGIIYDKNGNIGKLKRLGWTVESPSLVLNTGFGTMDELVYTYDSGNKLTKVLDNGNDTYGFTDSSADNQDYWYDGNGNMVRDLNKGIGTASVDGIGYNHLNLPEEVKFDNSSTKKIIYIYDALGTKLKKMTNNNGSLTTTDYAGNYVYENGALQFFSHPEGYVSLENNGYRYVYQYRDHLGNIRLSYTDDPSNPGTPTIIEENNYYPFGLEHRGYNNVVSANANSTAEKFKYQGQELEESLGLDLYEFELRQYDPAIGRFTSIDPVTHFDYSTYSAFDNNPVFWADPSGADATQFVMDLFNRSGSGETKWTNNNDGTFSSDDGQTAETPKHQFYGVNITGDVMNLSFDNENFNWVTGYGEDPTGLQKAKASAFYSAFKGMSKVKQLKLLKRLGVPLKLAKKIAGHPVSPMGAISSMTKAEQDGLKALPVIGEIVAIATSDFESDGRAIDNMVKWDNVRDGFDNMISTEVLNDVILIYSNANLFSETTINTNETELSDSRYPQRDYKYVYYGTQYGDTLHIFGRYDNPLRE
ncbi:DUF6443 domain-containing protein [Muricauda sp. SCSIO 64092]|uniref:DUF6443 domain-containing protein n=1 Tax=Allomuricauda sp. SCSIO 64092 TaxID=2908842 RepID=UPI001FF5069C|nr:DUF6443 domain-containing protein [Muricauda sp. SCSIO 64092]UOY08884.1 DUF6443 domain-containing protein [Muricauda sp. SCSIO 64092]